MVSNKGPRMSALAFLAVLALVSSLVTGAAYADTGMATYSTAQADLARQARASQPAAAKPAPAFRVQAQEKKGWVSTSAGKSYYRNGAKLTGLQAIGANRYFFNSKGILRTSDVKVGSATYYIEESGKLIGAKLNGACYYNTLQRMSKADAYDFETYLQARSIVKRITGKNDSRETKLHKSFDWVMNKYYEIHRTFNPFSANWTAVYARDHFSDIGGDCHADAAAFAYLAAAIGYPADVCLDSVSVGTPGSHAWCMIGNKVYDPLFAQSKSYAGYYGVTSGTYETNPTARYRVPRFNPANAPSKRASNTLANAGLNGLKEIGGRYYYFKNGSKLTRTWKTVGSKRYYFKANGRAATLSTKVKGVYYVFDESGVLQSGKKHGVRVVKIGKTAFQVNGKGQAVAGFSKKGTRRFGKTGELLCGVHLIGGKLYAADKRGTYKPVKTEALQAAAVRGKPVSNLIRLLGFPQTSPVTSTNCDGGFDIIRSYKHFNVVSWQLENPAEAGYIAEGENAEQFKSIAAR